MEIKTQEQIHFDNNVHYGQAKVKWVKVVEIKNKLKSFKDLFELGSNESSALAGILESLNK